MGLRRKAAEVLIASLLLPVWLLGQEKPRPQSRPLIFTQVTVIDATGAPPQPDMTVTIIGDRIAALGKTGKVKLSKQALVIDARGKFLVPGLWDMHVHVWDKAFFPLFVANGVTGVRDVGTSRKYQEQFEQWRKEITYGRLLGPRVVACGLMVDGPDSPYPDFSIRVTTEADARQAVRSLKRSGADCIKVQSTISHAAYIALADEAKNQGLSLVGHVPFAVSPAEASNAGQKSIEHLTGVLLACSIHEEELRKTMIQESAKSPASYHQLVLLLFFFPPPEDLLHSYSEAKAMALFAQFVRNGTWQVPTFTLWRSYTLCDESRVAIQEGLKYVPPSMREDFDSDPSCSHKGYTAEEIASGKVLLQKNLELVQAMRRAGVEFLAGTDAPSGYVIPGFSLHDELSLLVQAGLTPMEALQSATRNAAKFLGKLNEWGTVEKGKIADLVLLDSNPLEDIHNTNRIDTVVLRGKYLPRSELDKVLAEVADRRDSPR